MVAYEWQPIKQVKPVLFCVFSYAEQGKMIFMICNIGAVTLNCPLLLTSVKRISVTYMKKGIP